MNTVGNYFKTLGILHAAMCAGAALILGIFRYIGKDHKPADTSQVFFIVGVVIAAMNLILSRVMLFKIASPAQQQPGLADKLALFRTGFIVQMALLESAVLINAVLWFLGANTFNFGAAMGLLFLMIFRRPARSLVQGLIFTPAEDGRVIYHDETEL